MRFATWNLSHAVKRGRDQRAEAWRHLASLETDVAMVQEAGQPITGVTASVVGADRQQKDWVTAVVSYGPLLLELTNRCASAAETMRGATKAAGPAVPLEAREVEYDAGGAGALPHAPTKGRRTFSWSTSRRTP